MNQGRPSARLTRLVVRAEGGSVSFVFDRFVRNGTFDNEAKRDTVAKMMGHVYPRRALCNVAVV
jgi:hypothetical protein